MDQSRASEQNNVEEEHLAKQSSVTRDVNYKLTEKCNNKLSKAEEATLIKICKHHNATSRHPPEVTTRPIMKASSELKGKRKEGRTQEVIFCIISIHLF